MNKSATVRAIAICCVVVAVVTAALWNSPAPKRTRIANLPAELNDTAFWQLVTDISEPGGFFRSDNFVSNERDFQLVINELKQNRSPGGVYLGVGPDQNFTYLVALQPKIAFILDIRRQNMIQHLMYKALLETATDRADFLSHLFSRMRPEGLSEDTDADTMFQAFRSVPPDETLFRENLKAIGDHLTVKHPFKLTNEDMRSLEYVYTAFYEGGPNLTYTFNVGQGSGAAMGMGFGGGRGGFGNRGMPSYSELMMRTDEDGHNRSYMGSSTNFKVLQDLERKNLIVPVVGDFAGAKALRAVGKYLDDHDATVSAFYVSNVEQYLFQQDDDWNHFYTNVGTLPIDSNSTFIRSVASGRRFQTRTSRASLLCPIEDILKVFNAGRLESYSQVIRMSH